MPHEAVANERTRLLPPRDRTTKIATYSPDVLGVWSTNVRNSDANDKVNLWFNKQNGHPIRLSFDTPVEKGLDGATGETIKAMINYRYLKEGEGFYPAHIDVTIPSRGLTIRAEHLAARKKD